MSSNTVVLLLGSNKNFPEKNIEKAMELIEKNVGRIIAKSKVLKTFPKEFVSCNIFCNIALSIITDFSPIKTLSELKLIEVEMGRVSDSKALGGYFDREIDIDIVYFNALFFKSEVLEIPHFKHTTSRDFSIELMNDILN